MGGMHATMEGIPLKCWEEFEDAALRAISDTPRLRESSLMDTLAIRELVLEKE